MGEPPRIQALLVRPPSVHRPAASPPSRRVDPEDAAGCELSGTTDWKTVAEHHDGDPPSVAESVKPPFVPFDPLRFPRAETTVVGAICVAIAVVASVIKGEVDADFLGWWTATSLALIAGAVYIERYMDWYIEGMRRRGILGNAVASVAIVCAAFTPALNESPQAAVFGLVLVAPFVVIAERWRRAAVIRERKHEGA